MQNSHYQIRNSTLAVYLFVNVAFVWKYTSRTSLPPLLCALLWMAVALVAFAFHRRFITTKQAARHATLLFLLACFAAIAFLLIKINPLDVNVDRWSATTYFLDALFRGDYPYGVHTHVCETNFPSPFPLWHYLQLPFWLLGDVGLALFLYLPLFILGIRWFTKSWRCAFTAMLLLALSPAYWWEVVVRSDGLSNAILIFCLILLLEHKHISFRNQWIKASLACGLTAVTRLSAILPLAIYYAKDFLKATWRRQLISILLMVSVFVFFFLPYILWDTGSWIFFDRNPFMSQTSTGNPIIMALMIALALTLALTCTHTFRAYAQSTTWFLFVFFLTSLVTIKLMTGEGQSWMEKADVDISYLTLSLPYCIYSLCTPQADKPT